MCKIDHLLLFLFLTSETSHFKALITRFNEAADNVKNLTKRPEDEELLELYALYKQGNFGDNNTAKPGLLDIKGRHKWEAWEKLKGTSKESAMEKYVAIVKKLIDQYS